MKETKLSRRAFLGLGATAAVAAGAAGLAGCAPQQGAGTASAEGNGGSGSAAASSVSPTNYTPDFLTPPEVPTDIKEEKDCDVLVIGMGLAGTAAAKEAAEAGKKVIVLEKQPEDSYSVISMAGDFGVVGSQIQKDLGIEWAPKADIMNEYVKETGGRCDTWMMSYWYDHSGEDFDWFIEGADYEVLKSTAANRETDKPNFIRPKCFPKLETYDYKEEVYPYFHGTITTNPNMQWACEAAFNAAMAAGAELIYEAEGEQLIKEGDKVVGVYASDEDGNIVRINAKKGVVLSCGDMSSDTEMLTYYAPQATKYGCFFSTMDKSGKPVNTGDGHKMAMWAGAVMEDGPYAPMTHSLGTNSVGIDPFLMVNQDGKRFANEDVGAQELQNAIKRQKGGVSYQIFDSKWKEQLSTMPQCFGGVTHYIPPEQEAEYEHAINHFAAGYASDTYFQGEIEQGSIIPADSIEELAKAVNIPADALVETVERYNELAHAGKDADFSKVSTRLFPVENPPYYAVPFGDSGMLVLIGGIDCDVDCRALDAEKNPVPGLFVAGNTMGGRFLVDYPVTVAGASHSMAMSFGRLAGRKAAEGK